MQRSLLKNKSFLSFIVVFVTTAINDNIYKSFLLVFLTLLIIDQSAKLVFWTNLVGALFILPYILFSGIAAIWANYVTRYKICVFIKLFEILIIILIFIAIYFKNIYFLVFCIFVLGLQSAIFSPSKYAYIPDLVISAGHTPEYKQLSLANSILESGTFMAILLGSAIGSIVATFSDNHSFIILVLMLIIALIGLRASFNLPKQRRQTTTTINAKDYLINNLKLNFKVVSNQKKLYLILANCLFWFIGSVHLLQLPILIVDFLKWQATIASYGFISFALGIFTASILINILNLTNKAIKQPFYIISAALATIIIGTFSLGAILEFALFLQVWHILILLYVIALAAGFYIIPLYSLLHLSSKQDDINYIFAANNFFGAFFMLLASALAWVLLSLLAIPLNTFYLIFSATLLCFMAVLLYKKRFFII